MLDTMILTSVVVGATLQDTELSDTPPLDAAFAVARWLDSVQVKTEHGIAWPVAPADSPDIARNLYSGTPGVILFFIELHHATGDDSYLERAKMGGDDLLASLPDAANASDLSLWTGAGGQGFVLNELAKATNDNRYRDGASRCVDLLIKHAMEKSLDANRWSGTTDIIRGAAGSGLFLLYAKDEMGRVDALRAAILAGDWLLTRARPLEMANNVRGLEWPMTEEYPRMMPNFSHGTAGVAYFLAALHKAIEHDETQTAAYDGRFLDAAAAGARHLLHIADTSGSGCRVYHHTPDGLDLYYLGWCHGPTGTARLFEMLYRATEQIGWREWLSSAARSVRTSGIPAKRTPGFWNNVGQCCGSAGVASFFLSLHEQTERPEDRDFAMTMHRDLLDRATKSGNDPGPMLSWLQAEHRVQPEFLQQQTGYMQGAAGIGLWLLQLHARQNGRDWTLRLPDSPW